MASLGQFDGCNHIVETAKENGLNPFHYLSYLFERLPNIDTTDREQLAQLLPW